MTHESRDRSPGAPSLGRSVFVVGTGRSGTNWLARLLEDHPDVTATIEDRWIFPLVTRMALDVRKRALGVPILVAAYRRRERKIAPRLYVDKSHPNLWLAELLASRMPEAYFLGIERNPYAVVASMLQHAGVLHWFHRWRRWPVPNSFLGITMDIAPKYDSLPLEQKCALRWTSHQAEMLRLVHQLPTRIFVVRYEQLIDDLQSELGAVWGALGLRPAVHEERVRVESRDKWRTQLTPQQIADVNDIVGFEPDEWQNAPRITPRRA